MSGTAGRVRVLVAGESPVTRDGVRRALADDAAIDVCGEAGDEVECLAQLERGGADVLVLDVIAPRAAELSFIGRVAAGHALPILVLAAAGAQGAARATLEALRAGAADAMVKPPQWDRASANALCARVRALASGAGPPRHARPDDAAPGEAQRLATRRVRFVGVGASAGGPPVLARLLSALPPRLTASVLLVQHIDDGFVDGLAEWLTAESGRDVRVARAGERPGPGDVRLAPGGRHLRVAPAGDLELRAPRPGDVHVPSVDELFTSLAAGFGARAAGVLASGLGRDGVAGLDALRRAGAVTLVQEPASAVAPGMPQAALAEGAAGRALRPAALALALAELVAG